MPVTEEDGGRLNAFAKEPKIEVITEKASYRSSFWLLMLAFGVLVTGLIRLTLNMS